MDAQATQAAQAGIPLVPPAALSHHLNYVPNTLKAFNQVTSPLCFSVCDASSSKSGVKPGRRCANSLNLSQLCARISGGICIGVSP